MKFRDKIELTLDEYEQRGENNMSNDSKRLGHLLIAGDTGSGKSVAENQIVKALLKKGAHLYLIDPKMVELNEYKDEENVVGYGDNIPDISDAIRHAYMELYSRLQIMKEKGIKTFPGNSIYVVIDEMLPIMSEKEYKKNGTINYLNQIAILGRAARVYLIVCTQRCTRKNVPELVKTCFFNRLCLRQYDTRDYDYVLNQKVEPFYSMYGECYLRQAGRPAELMKTDDAVRLLLKDCEEN